jgi:tetratricopeptide (TPR) repeat protein
MRKKKRASAPNDQPKTQSAFASPRAWALALVLAASFAAFANSLANGFAFDDQSQILNNQFIRDFKNLPTAFTTEVWFRQTARDQDPNEQAGPNTPYYRPLFTLYLMIGWGLFQDQPAGWHLFSVLMHLLVTYFVFLLLEKITGDLKLSTIAALLFAIHPLRVESVAWISGISDPLLAVFVIPSFYLYLLYRQQKKKSHLIGSLALFFLAPLSKEPALALPLFTVAYDLLIIDQDKPFSQRARKAALPTAIFGVLTITYFALRYNALGFLLSGPKIATFSAGEVVMTLPLVLWKYIGLMFFPFTLTLFHGTPVVKTPLDIRFILPLLGLAGLAVALWRLRGSSLGRFAILWFFIHMLPILNINTFSEDFMVQERYTYIPSIGFSLLLAMGLMKLPVERFVSFRNRRAGPALAVALVVLLLGAKTVAQNQAWKDDMTLWLHGLEAVPDSEFPYFILGHKYINFKQYDKAAETLENYMKIDPNNLIVITNLAAAHNLLYEATRDRAHVDRAIALSEKGLNIDDTNPALWDTLGVAYTFNTELKNLDRAIFFINRALIFKPDDPLLNFHMGAAHVQAGKAEEAMPFLEKAKTGQPALADIHLFIAYAHHNRGQRREAIDSYNEYLRLKPNAANAAQIRQDMEKLRAELQSQPLQSRAQSN